MKQCSADGVANKTNKADKVGITEENIFWEKNLLGFQTAKSLSKIACGN